MLKIKSNFVYLIIITASFLLYSFKLNVTPVHLNQDEAMFALNAYSIARNGHDFYGNNLPLYFWHLDSFWATPVIVYWTSIFLKFLPLNEATIRFSGVVLAVINIGLLMYLVNLVFRKRYLVVLSGILLALTPAFFINSRLLLDNTYPIFFVLLWLIFLVKNNYFLSALVLGLGIHSYHASKIYMPIYFGLTIIYLFFDKFERKLQRFLKLLVGFLIPLFLFLPWLMNHPDTLLNQVSYAKSIDSSLGSKFFSSYLKYFDLSFLFSYGDSSLIHSTGRAGVFLLPVFIFLTFGIIKVLKSKGNIFGKLLFTGLLLYPIAPSIINDPYRISRALIVVPFVILLCVCGIEYLWESKDKMLNSVLIFLISLSFMLFTIFLFDYFGSYRLKSPHLFNNNIGGAFESLLRSSEVRPVKRIYVDKNIFMARFYFEFYERKLNIYSGQVDYVDVSGNSVSSLEVGGILVSSQKFKNLGKSEVIETIREPNGNESYYIYWRDK